MGLDVLLYAEVAPGVYGMEMAEEFFTSRSSIGDAWRKPEFEGVLWLSGPEDRPRIEVLTLHRYYGPGYERGDWPSIYGAIRVLGATFPGAKVFYGSDSHDDGEECTEEFLDEMWEHFLGPTGDSYWNRR